MLAFIDSPVQLLVVMVVLLLVFGPQKLPEIGHQVGRALRELMKAKQEFLNSVNFDDRHETTYEPPRYDNYDTYDNSYLNTQTAAIPEEESWKPSNPDSGWQAAMSLPEPPPGDFAASALTQDAGEYGVGPAVTPTATARPDVGEAGFRLSAPEGTVVRGSARDGQD